MICSDCREEINLSRDTRRFLATVSRKAWSATNKKVHFIKSVIRCEKCALIMARNDKSLASWDAKRLDGLIAE